jgi:hypothetical protein
MGVTVVVAVLMVYAWFQFAHTATLLLAGSTARYTPAVLVVVV